MRHRSNDTKCTHQMALHTPSSAQALRHELITTRACYENTTAAAAEREKKSHAVSDRLATLNEMCDKMLKWMRRRRGEGLSVQQRGVSLQMR